MPIVVERVARFNACHVLSKVSAQRKENTMKYRKIKKQAKRFLEGKNPKGIGFHREVRYPRTDGTCIITELIPNGRKFRNAVTSYIGVPCHWDSPYIIDIWESEQD